VALPRQEYGLMTDRSSSWPQRNDHCGTRDPGSLPPESANFPRFIAREFFATCRSRLNSVDVAHSHSQDFGSNIHRCHSRSANIGRASKSCSCATHSGRHIESTRGRRQTLGPALPARGPQPQPPVVRKARTTFSSDNSMRRGNCLLSFQHGPGLLVPEWRSKRTLTSNSALKLAPKTDFQTANAMWS
jgi:hypothetical protein